MRATSPSLRITAKGHRPQIPPNTAEFLTNGATTPKTQGDCDRVAVHDPLQTFPVSVRRESAAKLFEKQPFCSGILSDEDEICDEFPDICLTNQGIQVGLQRTG